ncbi:translation initiation factor IF-2-like isoform X4 [Gopherus flavomarginatus]|uniref:translation initiation factor IF-2-like isoform X4 n=1 Tax=Gopherus flavomarginatus TaxID=286002 RepID=UPI0021CC2FB2|nr:translation initiation factor IF-2-like isoform X4 [Gopherus flavomarginatus]
MRLWLLAGLAAALTLVAVAGADLGDSTEVEDVVGEKEDRQRVRREDKRPRSPPSQPCPGCYSPLSKPGEPARARRQVEKQQQPRRRPRPEPTWRPGVLISLSKETPGEPARARRQVEKQQQPRRRPRPEPTWRPGSLIPLSEETVWLQTRREDKKLSSPPSQACPGCYSPLSKPGEPARAKRQVEKQQQPRRRPRPKPTWRPGSLSLLRPAKVEVQDSEVRTRREVERYPQQRPRPRSNSPGHSLYNFGYMTLLSSSSNMSLQEQDVLRPCCSLAAEPDAVQMKPSTSSLLAQGPAPQGRGRRAAEGTEPRTLKPKRPRLPCSGCYSPLVSPKDNHQQERVKREGQKPQQDRPTRKPTWRPGSGSILGLRPHEEVKNKLPAPKLPCPGCHGSVTTGQEGRSAEGILSPRTRREDERPTVAKRKAKQRARDGLYCAGCYSGLTLRSQTPPLREAADGGSSRD